MNTAVPSVNCESRMFCCVMLIVSRAFSVESLGPCSCENSTVSSEPCTRNISEQESGASKCFIALQCRVSLSLGISQPYLSGWNINELLYYLLAFRHRIRKGEKHTAASA